MSETGFSGGCQCGAVRFHAGKLGRASICHCRMCQKHTYHYPGGVEIAIGAFDHPEKIEPQVQVNIHKRMPWIEQLFAKPAVEQGVDEAEITSYQHPDHDTAEWPPEER
ncbi:MAG: GFA family protein [Rhizobium pusense]|nr:GFA family protein [Agrobacterium pusense]